MLPGLMPFRNVIPITFEITAYLILALVCGQGELFFAWLFAYASHPDSEM